MKPLVCALLVLASAAPAVAGEPPWFLRRILPVQARVAPVAAPKQAPPAPRPVVAEVPVKPVADTAEGLAARRDEIIQRLAELDEQFRELARKLEEDLDALGDGSPLGERLQVLEAHNAEADMLLTEKEALERELAEIEAQLPDDPAPPPGNDPPAPPSDEEGAPSGGGTPTYRVVPLGGSPGSFVPSGSGGSFSSLLGLGLGLGIGYAIEESNDDDRPQDGTTSPFTP